MARTESLFISPVMAIIIYLISASAVAEWVEQGRDVILYCNLGGTEESFDWTRGPNYTASTQHLLAYNNGGVIRGACLTKGKCELLGKDLKVKNVQISDEDTYYCGTPKSYTRVQLNVTIQPPAPTINNCESQNCEINFPVGFVLHLICAIRRSRPAADLLWKIDEKEVTNITKTSVHINYDGTFDTVMLLHIKHKAPAVYKCEAFGPSVQHSTRTTAEINVTVINQDSQDHISKFPEIDFCRIQTNCSIIWPKGFQLEMQCVVRGVQNAIKLSWWHKQQELYKNTTIEVHRDNLGYTIVSTVTLYIRENSSFYCQAPELASRVTGGTSTSTIFISSTESFPLEYSGDKSQKDVWKIFALIFASILLFLLIGIIVFFIFRRINRSRTGACMRTSEKRSDGSKFVQESSNNDKESDPMMTPAKDEPDAGRKQDHVVKYSKVIHPTESNSPSSANGETSSEDSCSPVSESRTDGKEQKEKEQRVTSAATYSNEREILYDGEGTTSDKSFPTTSVKAVLPWNEEETFEPQIYGKLSSSEKKGLFITANLIRNKHQSFNFSLEDQRIDIILSFTMKGHGLILSFVPYLGPCDEGYIIHFRQEGDILFSKHGHKIDLSDNNNFFDPSKKLKFMLNIACKKVLLMMVDEDNNKKPLLRYTPVQTELCEYLVVSAHENSEFDMVLLPRQ